jgi:hypothetical protein
LPVSTSYRSTASAHYQSGSDYRNDYRNQSGSDYRNGQDYRNQSGPTPQQARRLHQDAVRKQREIDAANPTHPSHWNKEVSPMDSAEAWIQMEWQAWRNAQINVSGSYVGDGFFDNDPGNNGQDYRNQSGSDRNGQDYRNGQQDYRNGQQDYRNGPDRNGQDYRGQDNRNQSGSDYRNGQDYRGQDNRNQSGSDYRNGPDYRNDPVRTGQGYRKE